MPLRFILATPIVAPASALMAPALAGHLAILQSRGLKAPLTIKRKAKAIGIFPNDRAIVLLVGAADAEAERRMGGPTPLHEPGVAGPLER